MKSLLTSVSFAALIAFSLPAAAQSITLGPNTALPTQACDLTSNVGGTGTITVQCGYQAKGSASFGAASGPYVIGVMNDRRNPAVFGPVNSSGVLPVIVTADASQSFSYGPDSAGNQTVGTITWMVLDFQSKLTGVYDPSVVLGTPEFTAGFAPGHSYSASVTLSGGFPITTLLATPSKSGPVSIGKGEIDDGPAQCKSVTTTICN